MQLEENIIIAGVDEVGRGPLAGPVVAAAVILDPNQEIEGINDSKKLTEKKRELLYEKIFTQSIHHIVSFSALQVDELGISACMHQALESIKKSMDTHDFLFDGNVTFGVEGLKTLIKADNQIEGVKVASILAKVTHDRVMNEEAKRFPEYGFESHKGYGTKAHIEAIKEHGYCELHRRSFKVKALEGTLF